jgi:hypothetical protein
MKDVRRMLESATAAINNSKAWEQKRGGDTVVHVCPECGGDLAAYLGASILVQTCWACAGVGTLTDDQLSGYMQRSAANNTGLIITADDPRWRRR